MRYALKSTLRWLAERERDGCRYCGSSRYTPECPESTCLACGLTQCHSNGGARGQCDICHYGLLPGWSGWDRPCGYAGCRNRAVAAAPRVRYACRDHLARASIMLPHRGHVTLAEYIATAIREVDSRFALVGT